MRKKLMMLMAFAMLFFSGIAISQDMSSGVQQLPEFAKNLGSVVNSKFSDFGPIISADGNALYFTSDREGGHGGQDIWVSRRSGGDWGPPVNLGALVNTELNEGPDTFSVDEQTLYFTGCNWEDESQRAGEAKKLRRCEIYMSKRISGDQWDKPVNIGDPINTKYNEANASLTYDGRTLYYVSQRPDGFGGWDIWVSHMQDNDKWGEPKNLGPKVNTSEEEFISFIATDGVTLYFSSNGHGGFGGADIFVTRLDPATGEWSDPENLGPLINTPYNDMYFTIPASGDLAYFSSNRGDTTGQEDIYTVPIPILFQQKKVMIVRGIVADKTTCAPPKRNPVTGIDEYDIATCRPVQGMVRMAEITGKEVASMPTAMDGSYQVVIPSGGDFTLSATAKNYAFHSERFTVPEKHPFQVIERNILLVPLGAGAQVPLNLVFFDFDKSTLRPESKNELNNLITLLKENPSMRIEIQGHCDIKGTDEYNITLSKNRAKAVRDYVAQVGKINPKRLTSVGYGKSRPIASNETDEGRQMNRRVEFRIVEK